MECRLFASLAIYIFAPSKVVRNKKINNELILLNGLNITKSFTLFNRDIVTA